MQKNKITNSSPPITSYHLKLTIKYKSINKIIFTPNLTNTKYSQKTILF